MEKWKDIKGYEGLYQVSNKGRVRSLDHYIEATKGHPQLCKGRLLKNWIHPETHYVVTDLYKDNIRKHVKTHRLVAEAFIPNPENKPFIDHINRDRQDNRVENLRWVTKTENMNNPLTLKAISVAQRKRFCKNTLQ